MDIKIRNEAACPNGQGYFEVIDLDGSRIRTVAECAQPRLVEEALLTVAR